MSDVQTQDVLIFLNPKDLIGRRTRKRKGAVYTALDQRCVNIWLAARELEGLRIGRVEYTISASSSYLWHRREIVEDMVLRSHALLPPT